MLNAKMKLFSFVLSMLFALPIFVACGTQAASTPIPKVYTLSEADKTKLKDTLSNLQALKTRDNWLQEFYITLDTIQSVFAKTSPISIPIDFIIQSLPENQRGLVANLLEKGKCIKSPGIAVAGCALNIILELLKAPAQAINEQLVAAIDDLGTFTQAADQNSLAEPKLQNAIKSLQKLTNGVNDFTNKLGNTKSLLESFIDKYVPTAIVKDELGKASDKIFDLYEGPSKKRIVMLGEATLIISTSQN